MAPTSLGTSETAPETNSVPRPNSGILDEKSTSSQWTVPGVLRQMPESSRPQSFTSSPVPFFHLLERLKTTRREGWRRFSIVHGESISDHMYRMSIITMLAPRSLSSRLDIPKCTKMALVHDMAESLVGDITPVDGVSKVEKSRRESTTMDFLCKDLLGGVEGGVHGQELRQIWQEYENGQTLESRFVHDVDKIELVLQMVDYERSQSGRVDLGEFEYVASKIELPEVRSWCKEILAERKAFWKSLGTEPTGIHQVSKETEAMQNEYYAKR